MEEDIKIHQGGISILEYSLKFSKLYKNSPSLVSNRRDDICHFLTEVFEDLIEEFCSAMFHENMNICRLMVHAQQVKETRVKRNNREVKRVNSCDCAVTNCRVEH